MIRRTTQCVNFFTIRRPCFQSGIRYAPPIHVGDHLINKMQFRFWMTETCPQITNLGLNSIEDHIIPQIIHERVSTYQLRPIR